MPDSPGDELLGVHAIDIGAPEEIVVLDPRPRVVDAYGRLPAGILFMAADISLGLALTRVAPADRQLITSHLHLDLVPRANWRSSAVQSQADTVAVDGLTGLALATLTADELPIGLATARFEVLERSVRAAGQVGDGVLTPAGPRTVAVGVETLDIDEALSLRMVSADESIAHFEAAALPSLANNRGGLHGGIGGLITERCATLAVEKWTGAGRGVHVAELRVFFARPVAADGQLLRAQTTRRRLGSRVVLTSTAVQTLDGRDALLADAIHLIDVAPTSS